MDSVKVINISDYIDGTYIVESIKGSFIPLGAEIFQDITYTLKQSKNMNNVLNKFDNQSYRDNPAFDDEDIKIAEFILPHIADGTTIQLGIGGTPNALGALIADSDLKDLGMHTELMSDGYLKLYHAGKITNKKKLLNRLEKMIEDTKNGELIRSEISEEKLSAVENSLKRYLDDNLLENKNQKRQKELIQKLISDIAHQTLTPVSNLKIYTELLWESQKENEIINTIMEQTDKLEFLIESLIKLSRLESGIIEVHPKEAPLQDLFDKMKSNYMTFAKDKNLNLWIADTELFAVYDLKWTEEALGNIIDNAIKYTEEGKNITVTAEEYSFFVRIDVKDEGIGIAEEEIPKIFSRFYRSYQVSEMQGVGIGLYLAREIIKAQSGYIKVGSILREGSVFSVFLPKPNSIHSVTF